MLSISTQINIYVLVTLPIGVLVTLKCLSLADEPQLCQMMREGGFSIPLEYCIVSVLG